jgi:hypothetical protein
MMQPNAARPKNTRPAKEKCDKEIGEESEFQSSKKTAQPVAALAMK